MKLNEIEALLEKFYEGDTSLEEENILKAYFSGNNIPEQLRTHVPYFKFYGNLSNTSKEELPHDDILYAKVNKLPKARVIEVEWYKIAASIALLVIGFASGYLFNQHASGSSEELTSLQSDVQEMKKMLMLSQIEQTSASERIKAVNQMYELKTPDKDIISALIHTMNTDENANVRLAACEALFSFRKEQKVREALIASLPQQNDPAIQITIIDMLVSLKERKAVQEIKRLIEDGDVKDVVKTKARERLHLL